MRLRKLIVLGALVAFVGGISSCSKKSDSTTTDSTTTTTTTTAPATPPPPPPPPPPAMDSAKMMDSMKQAGMNKGMKDEKKAMKKDINKM